MLATSLGWINGGVILFQWGSTQPNAHESEESDVKSPYSASQASQKNEPWRYSILCSPHEIEKYLDFLDNWYEKNETKLQSGELEKFKTKIEGVRKEWPFKVSHLILLGMRRESKPDKR